LTVELRSIIISGMDIFSFSEEKDPAKAYAYKVLVYPNITYARDLEKDSYVVVIDNIISRLEKVRSDIHWTLLLPEKLKIFNRKNIDQIIYSLPTYPNQMRCHFDTNAFLEAIDWKNNDFDVVYTHLPEHTLQIKNVLYNMTNLRPEFVGYSHWTEFPEITEYPMSLIDYNFLGLMEMNKCGVNTNSQKKLIIKHASKLFKKPEIDKLESVLVPQYLGCEDPVFERVSRNTKIIVFNHRPHEYKDYPWFLDQMDELWKKRQDFRVWVPLAEKSDREYIDIGMNGTRYEYLSNLSGCTLGVCGKQKYAGWSVSATDGMSVGVPYIFADEDYYRELAENAGLFYKDDETFLLNVNTLFDNAHVRLEYSNQSIERFQKMLWSKAIIPFNEMFQETFDQLTKLKEKTDSYKEIVDFIKKNGSVSKNDILEHMGWGIRITFSSYRNKLREEESIVFTKNRYEYKLIDKVKTIEVQ
jgi:glycosyltransferase involved in cell wall biosynthesis